MSRRLGITDIRKINSTLQSLYSIDFSEYGFTFFKRQIEFLMHTNNFTKSDDFILFIQKEKNFLESLYIQLAVEETEMFRDPSFWQYLKSTILSKLKRESEYHIWLPDVSSGEELFTLLIILKEEGIYDKCRITVSSQSSQRLKFVETAYYEMKKMQNNSANYMRYQGEKDLIDYYTQLDNKAVMDQGLLKNVTFRQESIKSTSVPSHIKLILFRNKMLYYSTSLQTTVLRRLHSALLPGGYIAFGIKESLDCCNQAPRFVAAHKDENIYKKTV